MYYLSLYPYLSLKDKIRFAAIDKRFRQKLESSISLPDFEEYIITDNIPALTQIATNICKISLPTFIVRFNLINIAMSKGYSQFILSAMTLDKNLFLDIIATYKATLYGDKQISKKITRELKRMKWFIQSDDVLCQIVTKLIITEDLPRLNNIYQSFNSYWITKKNILFWASRLNKYKVIAWCKEISQK